MRKYLLPEKGNFYKANLHTHTTVSDGRRTPEEVKKAYKEAGYSVLAYTDHEAFCPHNDLTDEDFLVINGIELSTNESGIGDFLYCKTYHINLYAKDPDCKLTSVWDAWRLWPAHAKDYLSEEQKNVDYRRWYSVDSINDLIARANEEGFLVCYNHPVWSTQNYADYADLKGLWGVEVYNTGCVREGSPDTPQPLDDLLRKGERLCPVAADDSHGVDDCFGGFVMIKAEKLEYKTVMEALERGDCYASSGPLIEELYVEDGVMTLRCSPAKQVFFTTESRLMFRVNAKDEPVTNVAFNMSVFLEKSKSVWAKKEPYIRVTVVDEQGERAYTRAYFLDELI